MATTLNFDSGETLVMSNDGAVLYNFGNSPEELQKVIWELSVEIKNLTNRVILLEERYDAIMNGGFRHRPNQNIRNALAATRMSQWELAELLGISESGLARKLRKELSEREQKRIIWIIDNPDKYKQMLGIDGDE